MVTTPSTPTGQTVTGDSRDDRVRLGDGAHVVMAGGGNNRVSLGDGAQTVTALDGDDHVRTGDGGGTFALGDGANRLRGGNGDHVITTGDGDDRVRLGDGDQTLDLGGGRNSVTLGSGAATITSGDGADLIRGDDATLTASLGGGDNHVRVGAGDHEVTAGAGDDRVIAGDGDSVVSVGDGDNRVRLGNGDHRIETGVGDDHIRVGDGVSAIMAGDGDNRVRAGDGDFTVTTGAGDDRVRLGTGDHLVDLGDGRNVLTVGDGSLDVTGGEGADIVRGGNVTLTANLGDGDNHVRVGDGDHEIATGRGNDRVVAGDGDSVVTAGDGDNRVRLGDGEHFVSAGVGNDHVRLGDGVSTVDVGDGDNRVRAGEGSHTVIAGSGNDRVSLQDGDHHALNLGDGDNRVHLTDGGATITTGSGNDVVRGDDVTLNAQLGDGDNHVRVDNGDHRVTTGWGDDRIIAGDGDSAIAAGDGDNRVRLGDGDHTVTAGGGDDHVRVGDGASMITLGDGDNRLRADTGAHIVTAGSGDNRVSLDDGDHFVRLGDGENRVSLQDGNSTVVTGAGNDRIRADDGDLTIFTAAGDDYIRLDDGAALINAGTGNDRVITDDGADDIRGGAGDDRISAGRGDDIVRYDLDANLGANDWIDGGQDTDTLVLEMTEARWTDTAVRDDLAAFQAHIDAGHAGRTFTFSAFELKVRNVEILRVEVDGVERDPNAPAVEAEDDAATTGENTVATGNVLDNDTVASARTVTLVQGVTLGALTLDADGAWSFDPGTDFDHLAIGQTATETFKYRVTDGTGIGDEATVTIQITGANDIPTVAPIDAGAVNEDVDAIVVDLLANALDKDEIDDLDTRNVEITASDGRAVAFDIDHETGILTVDPAQFDFLNDGENIDLTINYRVVDRYGASVSNTATVTVNGVDNGDGGGDETPFVPTVSDRFIIDAINGEYFYSDWAPRVMIDVVNLSDGGRIAIYGSFNAAGSQHGISTRRLDEDGRPIGDETFFTADSPRGDLYLTGFDRALYSDLFSAHPTSDGGFLIAYTDRTNKEWGEPRVWRFDGDGQAVSASIDLSEGLPAASPDPVLGRTGAFDLVVKPDGDGGYVAEWWQYEGSARVPYTISIDSLGTPTGPATALPALHPEAEMGRSDLLLPHADVGIDLEDGTFLEIETRKVRDVEGGGVFFSEIYAINKAADGTVLSSTLISNDPDGGKLYPTVEKLPDGGYSVAWLYHLSVAMQEDAPGGHASFNEHYVTVRHFEADGTPRGETFRLDVDYWAEPTLHSLDNGKLLLSYKPNSSFDEHNLNGYTFTVHPPLNETPPEPVATDDTAAASLDAEVVIDVLDNDTVHGDEPATVVSAVAAIGAVTIGDDGRLTYAPDMADFPDLAYGDSQEVVITYTIEDAHGQQASASVTVTVSNDTPPDDDTPFVPGISDAFVIDAIDGPTPEADWDPGQLLDVALTGNGDRVGLYKQYNGATDEYGLAARFLDDQGRPASDEWLISLGDHATHPFWTRAGGIWHTAFKSYPTEDGGFILTYVQHESLGIDSPMTWRFGADGRPAADPVNLFDLVDPSDWQNSPRPERTIAHDAQLKATEDGGYVAIWRQSDRLPDTPPGPWQGYAVAMDGNGVPTAAAEPISSILPHSSIGRGEWLPDGSFIAVDRMTAASGEERHFDIVVRKWDEHGTYQSAQVVSEEPAGGSAFRALATLPDGGFSVAWGDDPYPNTPTSRHPDDAPFLLTVRHFDADGEPRGETIRLEMDEEPLPGLYDLGNGNVLLSYARNTYPADDLTGHTLSVYEPPVDEPPVDDDGGVFTPGIGERFTIDTYDGVTANADWNPRKLLDVATLNNGDHLAIYSQRNGTTDEYSLAVRRLDGDGRPVGEEVLNSLSAFTGDEFWTSRSMHVSARPTEYETYPTEDGGFILAYIHEPFGTQVGQPMLWRFDSDGRPTGDPVGLFDHIAPEDWPYEFGPEKAFVYDFQLHATDDGGYEALWRQQELGTSGSARWFTVDLDGNGTVTGSAAPLEQGYPQINTPWGDWTSDGRFLQVQVDIDPSGEPGHRVVQVAEWDARGTHISPTETTVDTGKTGSYMVTSLVVLPDDGYSIAWHYDPLPYTSNSSHPEDAPLQIGVAHFDAEGQQRGETLWIETGSNQTMPWLHDLGNGKVLLTTTSNADVWDHLYGYTLTVYEDEDAGDGAVVAADPPREPDHLGTEGDDILVGQASDEVLDGGAGNDLLIGGAGADIFVFRDDAGDDTIADFEDDVDLIDMSQVTGVESLADLTLVQDGDDVVIDGFGDDASIRVRNTSLSDLTEDDFLF